MKTQFRDPDGILNSLQHIVDVPTTTDQPTNQTNQTNPDDSPISVEEFGSLFFLLSEATESFDMCMIKRSQAISNKQRRALMQLAMTPLSLRRQCRLKVHKCVRAGALPHIVDKLDVPLHLKSYLLYDYC